jgi:hypothetical protein
MTFDSRWKNPQGKDPEQLWRWAQELIAELRKGDFFDAAFEDNVGDGITNAQLADMAAWTIKMRNNAASGDPQDQTINQLTEETSIDPAADFLPIWDAGGAVMRKAKPRNLGLGWVLIEQRAVNGDEAFTDLGSYSEIRVLLVGVTTSSSAIRQLQVSTDNGSTWLTSSGDYVSVKSDGVEANVTAMAFHRSASTAARGSEFVVRGLGLAAPKVAARSNGDQDSSGTEDRAMYVIPTTTAINAVRVNSSAGTPNGGTIYLFGR